MYINLQARISCDVRWQLASEMVDQRYVGEHVGLAKPKAGLYAKDDEGKDIDKQGNKLNQKISISELKSKWGLELDVEEGKRLNEEWGPILIR